MLIIASMVRLFYKLLILDASLSPGNPFELTQNNRPQNITKHTEGRKKGNGKF